MGRRWSSLFRTPDILSELGSSKGDRVLVGFAAETEDVEAAGRKKLRPRAPTSRRERGRARGTGFGSDTNRAAILAADGQDELLREWTKRELAAAAICDRLAKLPTR